jgi:hypothetical protein
VGVAAGTAGVAAGPAAVGVAAGTAAVGVAAGTAAVSTCITRYHHPRGERHVESLSMCSSSVGEKWSRLNDSRSA